MQGVTRLVGYGAEEKGPSALQMIRIGGAAP